VVLHLGGFFSMLYKTIALIISAIGARRPPGSGIGTRTASGCLLILAVAIPIFYMLFIDIDTCFAEAPSPSSNFYQPKFKTPEDPIDTPRIPPMRQPRYHVMYHQ
jgi:hypothetical protein